MPMYGHVSMGFSSLGVFVDGHIAVLGMFCWSSLMASGGLSLVMAYAKPS